METNGSLSIREAVGIFSETQDLQRAIDELLAAGFERTEFGLLAGEFTVKQQLGDIYISTNEFSGTKSAPNIAFVHKDSVGDTIHALLGNLYLMGGTTMVGGVVITAGVFGGAMLPAAAGILAVGAIGAVIGMIISQSDAEYLEEHVNAGHLVFFVRLKDVAQEATARHILAKHCNFDINDIKVLTVPINKPDSDPPRFRVSID